MGTINAEVNPRSEKEKRKLYNDPGWDTNARSESGSNGYKQERTDRKDSPRLDFIGNGTTITGKILRQLIEDYENQVVNKREQKERLQGEINQIDSEINQASNRIDECRNLLEQIEPNKQT